MLVARKFQISWTVAGSIILHIGGRKRKQVQIGARKSLEPVPVDKSSMVNTEGLTLRRSGGDICENQRANESNRGGGAVVG